MLDIILGLVIILFVALLIFIIGIKIISSDSPNSFYSNGNSIDSSKISDVRKWNKKHGVMLIIYSIWLIVIYIISIFFHGSNYMYIIYIIGAVAPIIPMCIYHSYLKKIYYIE